MKPLNHLAQKAAIQKFVIAYALSILLILVASYFWFSSPAHLATDDLKKNNSFVLQHDSLVLPTSNIANQINTLREFESKNAGVTNPATDTQIGNYLTGIRNAVHDLSADSSKITYPTLAASLQNFRVACDALLTYGEEGRALRGKNTMLQTMLDSKPSNGQNPLNTLLATCMAEKETLQKQVQKQADELKKKPVTSPPVSTGGGNNAASLAEIAKLKDDNERLSQERDQYRNAKAQADDQIRQKDAQIRNLSNNVTQPTAGGCTEADKANAMFRAADIMYDKGMSEKKDVRRGYLMGAMDILRNGTTQNYSDKGKLQSRIREIQNLLNPIGNN